MCLAALSIQQTLTSLSVGSSNSAITLTVSNVEWSVAEQASMTIGGTSSVTVTDALNFNVEAYYQPKAHLTLSGTPGLLSANSILLDEELAMDVFSTVVVGAGGVYSELSNLRIESGGKVWFTHGSAEECGCGCDCMPFVLQPGGTMQLDYGTVLNSDVNMQPNTDLIINTQDNQPAVMIDAAIRVTGGSNLPNAYLSIDTNGFLYVQDGISLVNGSLNIDGYATINTASLALDAASKMTIRRPMTFNISAEDGGVQIAGNLTFEGDTDFVCQQAADDGSRCLFALGHGSVMYSLNPDGGPSSSPNGGQPADIFFDPSFDVQMTCATITGGGTVSLANITAMADSYCKPTSVIAIANLVADSINVLPGASLTLKGRYMRVFPLDSASSLGIVVLAGATLNIGSDVSTRCNFIAQSTVNIKQSGQLELSSNSNGIASQLAGDFSLAGKSSSLTISGNTAIVDAFSVRGSLSLSNGQLTIQSTVSVSSILYLQSTVSVVHAGASAVLSAGELVFGDSSLLLFYLVPTDFTPWTVRGSVALAGSICVSGPAAEPGTVVTLMNFGQKAGNVYSVSLSGSPSGSLIITANSIQYQYNNPPSPVKHKSHAVAVSISVCVVLAALAGLATVGYFVYTRHYRKVRSDVKLAEYQMIN